MTKIVRMKKYDPEDIRKTVHFQPGPMVYLWTLDSVIDMRSKEWPYIAQPLYGNEIVGSGQGTGIETEWYDGSNLGFVNSPDPYFLKTLANRVKKHFRKKEAKVKVVKGQATFINDEREDDWIRKSPSNKRDKEAAEIAKKRGKYNGKYSHS